MSSRSSWRTTRLKFIAGCNLEVLSEGTPPDFEFNYVDIGNVTQGSLHVDQTPIRFGDAPSRARRIAQPGDSVVSTVRTYLRAVATVPETGMPLVFSTGFAVLHPLEGVSGRFLAYLLQGDDFVDRMVAQSTGVSYPAIAATDLMAMAVGLPSLDEQRAIADFLDEQTSRIDTLIGKQTQLIDTLRERRSASVTAELFEAAAGAPEDKLSRRAKIGNGSTPRRETTDYWNGGDFPWLNSAVVNARRVCGSDQFVTALARRECHLPTVRPGAVLVGLTGQGRTRGMATILEIEATVSQHVAYVQPDPAFWNSEFLYWSLGARYDELRRMSDENGSTKGGLTCFDLARLRVRRPGMSRQEVAVFRIADQTSRIDALIVKAEEFIGLARERRAALITAAVTGQIDVRTAGRAATVGA